VRRNAYVGKAKYKFSLHLDIEFYDARFKNKIIRLSQDRIVKMPALPFSMLI